MTLNVTKNGEKKQSMMDRLTDWQTDRAGHRVACTRLKMSRFKNDTSNLSFWAAAPKGTKSCRTQRDFCSSFCHSVRSSPQALSGLESALLGLKSALLDMKSALLGLKSALLSENLPSQMRNLPSQALRGWISGLRGQISCLRGPEGVDEWKDGRTNKSPPVGPLPCFLSNSLSCKAGQRVSLTKYCPWVTWYFPLDRMEV